MMTTTANATGKGPCSEDRYEVTKGMDRDVRVHKMRGLIRCVFTHLGIEGQIGTAFDVIDRESSYWPWAKNPAETSACRPWSSTPYGSCGLAQHLARLWPGRVRLYLHEWMFPRTWPHVPVLQARANIIVMGHMVRAGGWGPWSL